MKVKKLIVNMFVIFISLCSLFLYCLLIYSFTHRHFIIGLIAVIPVFLAFKLREKLYKNEIQEILKIICIMIGIMFIFAVTVIVTVAASGFRDITTPVTNYIEYSRLVKHLPESLVYQFPKKIPKGAKNIKFYYNPPFLQGGECIKLEFKADKSQIDEILQKYTNDYRRASREKREEFLKDNGSTINYGIDLNNERKDVELYILQCEGFNHGKLSLIAVNTSHTEILFQAEDW